MSVSYTHLLTSLSVCLLHFWSACVMAMAGHSCFCVLAPVCASWTAAKVCSLVAKMCRLVCSKVAWAFTGADPCHNTSAEAGALSLSRQSSQVNHSPQPGFAHSKVSDSPAVLHLHAQVRPCLETLSLTCRPVNTSCMHCVCCAECCVSFCLLCHSLIFCKLETVAS